MPDPGAWTANIDAERAAAFLSGARNVLICTHAKPDGDACGSTVALSRALKRAGVASTVWYVAPIARWIPTVAAGTPWTEHAAFEPIPGERAAGFDTVAIVDTGSWSQLAEQRAALEAVGPPSRRIVLDHHRHGDAECAAERLIDPTCAAAAELIAPVCGLLAGVPDVSRLPPDIAGPLYLGVATDTGWFRFSNVTAKTLRMAADLLSAGADPPSLYQLVEQQDSPTRWRLLARALASLDLFELPASRGGGRGAIMTLRAEDFAQTGADRNDTPGFADMPLTIADVRVSAVLTEAERKPGQGPLTKISVRSKPGADAVDVNELLKAVGGGGHARAAGARIEVDVAGTARTLREMLA